VSTRAASRLALALLAASLLLGAGLVLLAVLSWGITTPGEDFGVVGVLFGAAILAYLTIGVLIVSRRPGHVIGWLYCVVGFLFSYAAFAPAYADYALYAKPGSLPAAEWVAWSASWLDGVFIASVAFLMLFFPTGRLPSRRWRPVLWLLLGATALAFLTVSFRPGPIWEDTLPVENPLGIERAGGLIDALGLFVWLGLVAVFVLSAASIVVRFRRSKGDERQQLKWIAFAALLVIVSFVLANLTYGGPIATGFLAVALAAIPVTTGIAILRYRLYDIDRLISKTLVYASLTVILGAAYVGLVLAGQAVFSSFAGGSDLAIAVSTLVVAALFLPVRSRVQKLVDRRFYRRRYDAQRTLEAFGARLREEVDLDLLTSDLRGVVIETMQPAHVSLWLNTKGLTP
jgi:hypothetical protein